MSLVFTSISALSTYDTESTPHRESRKCTLVSDSSGRVGKRHRTYQVQKCVHSVSFQKPKEQFLQQKWFSHSFLDRQEPNKRSPRRKWPFWDKSRRAPIYIHVGVGPQREPSALMLASQGRPREEAQEGTAFQACRVSVTRAAGKIMTLLGPTLPYWISVPGGKILEFPF